MPVVQGKDATNNEFYVANALTKYDIQFMFQVQLFGGRSIRGGQVLDFLCFTPAAQPVQVFGNYWHSGQLGSDDRLQLSAIEQYYGQPCVVIWGDESDTQEKAMQAVRQKVV